MLNYITRILWCVVVNKKAEEVSRDSSADNSYYQQQSILNLHKSGITTDAISSQTGIRQEKVGKIIQNANKRAKGRIS